MKVYLTVEEIDALSKAENGTEIVTTVEEIIAGRLAKRYRASPLANSPGNIRILQVRVNEQLFRKIQRVCRQRDLSVSGVCRELIEISLALPQKKTSADE